MTERFVAGTRNIGSRTYPTVIDTATGRTATFVSSVTDGIAARLNVGADIPDRYVWHTIQPEQEQ